MRHHSRFRKKGSVLIEFLVSIPCFMMMAVFPLQIMFFSLSQTTAQSAAMEGARYVSLELSGSKVTNFSSLPSSERQQIYEGLLSRMDSISAHNNNLLLFHDETGASVTPTFLSNVAPSTCDTAMTSTSYKRVICVYLQDSTSTSQPKVIVRVKAVHNVVGNIIPGLAGRLYARGEGLSNINRPDRYQYN